MIIDQSQICKYYVYFYQKLRSPKPDKKHRKFSEKELACVQKFINEIDKRYKLAFLGHNFLWNYFNFQFHYWSIRQVRLINNSYQEYLAIKDIICIPALDRYENRSENWDSFLNGKPIFVDSKISKFDLIEKRETESSDAEISIKEQFANTKEGYYNCQLLTSLYNKTHKVCRLCHYKENCKKELLIKSPVLYDLNVTNGH